MIFDSDIIIWIERGNKKAAKLFEETAQRSISLQTYLELLQCASNRIQQRRTKDFLRDFEVSILPLTENIGHRASIYIEQFGLSHGMRAGDAIIAATSVENVISLCSSNQKHYRAIPELDFKVFRP